MKLAISGASDANELTMSASTDAEPLRYAYASYATSNVSMYAKPRQPNTPANTDAAIHSPTSGESEPPVVIIVLAIVATSRTYGANVIKCEFLEGLAKYSPIEPISESPATTALTI